MGSLHSKNIIANGPKSSSALMERQWNFNEGRGPFGLKKNAEIWNGRVAQMAFVIIFLQELVSGKGVLIGLREGNIFNYIMLGLTGITIIGLSGYLAFKGTDDEIKRTILEYQKNNR